MPYKDPEDKRLYWKEYSKLKRVQKRYDSYKSNLKIKFGLTLEQYNEILIKQNFCCALCERHVSQFKIRLAVDHDHKTGRIRGLLCTSCNVALAVLGDSEESIQNVLDYLNDVDAGI